MTRKFRVVYHEFLNRELIEHIINKKRPLMCDQNMRAKGLGLRGGF